MAQRGEHARAGGAGHVDESVGLDVVDECLQHYGRSFRGRSLYLRSFSMLYRRGLRFGEEYISELRFHEPYNVVKEISCSESTL